MGMTLQERKKLFKEAEEIRREFLALQGGTSESQERRLKLKNRYEAIDRLLGDSKTKRQSEEDAIDRAASRDDDTKAQDRKTKRTPRTKTNAALVMPRKVNIAELPREINSKSLNEWAKQQTDKGVPRQDLEDYVRNVEKIGYTNKEFNCLLKLEYKLMDYMVKRNAMAISRERGGKLSQAIKLYTSNVTDRFGGSGPYERLRILYTKQKDFTNAIRACEAYLALGEGGLESKKEHHFREHIKKLEGKIEANK